MIPAQDFKRFQRRFPRRDEPRRVQPGIPQQRRPPAHEPPHLIRAEARHRQPKLKRRPAVHVLRSIRERQQLVHQTLPPFRQSERETTHAKIGISQRSFDRVVRERPQITARRQRLDPGLWQRRSLAYAIQLPAPLRFNSGGVRCFQCNESLMRQIAQHSVRFTQRADELVSFCPGEIGNHSQLRPLRIHTIDAAHFRAGAGVELLQSLRRNPARVLHDEAIHVHDVERAVRPRARLHRTKPTVRAGEKLRSLFAVRPTPGVSHKVWFEHKPMHEIVNRLANEGVPVKADAQQRVPIDARPAAARHDVHHERIVETRERARRGEQLIRVAAARHEHARFRVSHVRIATQIVIRQRVMPEPGAVVVAEPVVEVITHAPVLADA